MAKKGINKVIIVGNLGGDPELRYMSNGNPVASFTVATSDSWKDKQTGQQHERTEWHRIVVFGKLGEIAGEYAKKGAQVYIEGRLQTREWEKDGIKRYTTEIVVDQNGTFQLLGKAAGSSNAGNEEATNQPRSTRAANQQSRQQPQRSQSAQSGAQPDYPDYDSFANDDIPFRPVPFLAMI